MAWKVDGTFLQTTAKCPKSFLAPKLWNLWGDKQTFWIIQKHGQTSALFKIKWLVECSIGYHLCLDVDNTSDKYTEHSQLKLICQVKMLKYFSPLQVMSVSTSTMPPLHWVILVSFPHPFPLRQHLPTVHVLRAGILLLPASLSLHSPSLNS